MPSPTSQLAPGDVRVYHADAAVLRADAGRLDRALAWLQPAERERFARFHADEDRLMFLCGRVMARALVGRALGRPAAAWRWQEGPHGRPEIAEPDTSLRFNLSHSAGLVVCALAEGREVGVDVEDLDRAQTDLGIVRRYCSPGEATDIEAQGPRGWHRRFLTYWTLKEAYLKARGLGVSVHLSDINFVLERHDESARVEFLDSLAGTDTRWMFRVEQPTSRHLLAIAASTAGSVRPTITIEPFPVGLLP
jgi:4'-phosphopantetheinyl transferase